MGEAIDVKAVRASRLGTGLSKKECEALGKVMRVHTLADGEVLAEEGQSDESLYLLVTGTLDVFRQESGADQHLHTMHEGEVGGVMGLLGDAGRMTTLRASGPVLVYSLQREALESLIEAYPRAVYRVMHSLGQMAYHIVAELGGQIHELTNYVTKQHGRY